MLSIIAPELDHILSMLAFNEKGIFACPVVANVNGALVLVDSIGNDMHSRTSRVEN
jgi:hypothetical protein